MSPTLVTRQYYGSNVCYDNNGNAYRCNSTWNDWGRWVALAIIIIGAVLVFFLFSCISARRRRRNGRAPFRGTGWAGQTPFGHGQAQYNPGYQTQNHPPPAYNQNNTQNAGGYYGENQGYFGGRGTDVEMQPPQNTHAGGVYNAPPGPPPAKK